MRSIQGFDVVIPRDVIFFFCEVRRYSYYDGSTEVVFYVIGRELRGLFSDCVHVKTFSFADMNKALDLVDELNAFLDVRREQNAD